MSQGDRPEGIPEKFKHRVDYDEGPVFFSDPCVLRSNAGYFVGRTCFDPDDGFEDMGSRESGYYPTEEAAEQALISGEFGRVADELSLAYENGLPPAGRNTVQS